MKPRARQENIVVQNLDGETLIYDLSIDKAFCLNATSAFVWQNCDGGKSVGEIAQALSKKTKQTINEDIVWLVIEDLKKENLMAEAATEANPLAGMSRREAVKRVGLATMIALPTVTGLIAPTAANAQSGGSSGKAACESCTANSECSSGFCVPPTTPTQNPNAADPPPNFDPNAKICRSGQSSTAYARGASFPAADSTACANRGSACCSGNASFSNGRCTCI